MYVQGLKVIGTTDDSVSFRMQDILEGRRLLDEQCLMAQFIIVKGDHYIITAELCYGDYQSKQFSLVRQYE